MKSTCSLPHLLTDLDSTLSLMCSELDKRWVLDKTHHGIDDIRNLAS